MMQESSLSQKCAVGEPVLCRVKWEEEEHGDSRQTWPISISSQLSLESFCAPAPYSQQLPTQQLMSKSVSPALMPARENPSLLSFFSHFQLHTLSCPTKGCGSAPFHHKGCSTTLGGFYLPFRATARSSLPQRTPQLEVIFPFPGILYTHWLYKEHLLQATLYHNYHLQAFSLLDDSSPLDISISLQFQFPAIVPCTLQAPDKWPSKYELGIFHDRIVLYQIYGKDLLSIYLLLCPIVGVTRTYISSAKLTHSPSSFGKFSTKIR